MASPLVAWSIRKRTLRAWRASVVSWSRLRRGRRGSGGGGGAKGVLRGGLVGGWVVVRGWEGGWWAWIDLGS